MDKIKIPFKAKLKKRLDLALGKKKTIFSLLAAGMVIGGVISLFLTKYYRADSKIFFEYNAVYSNLLKSSGNLNNELDLFYSTNFTENSIKKLSQKGFSVSRTQLSHAKEVIADMPSLAIVVQITDENPELSAEMANTLVDEFYETSILNSQSSFIHALKVITNRENSLQESINQDLSLQQGNIISSLSLDQEKLITQISEFESELENLELDNQIYSYELEKLTKILENRFPDISQELLFIESRKLDGQIEILERIEAVKSLAALSQKLGGFNIRYLWPDKYDVKELPSLKQKFIAELNEYLSDKYEEKVKSEKIFLQKLVDRLYEIQIIVNSIDLAESTIFNNLTSLESNFARIPFEKIDEARQSRMKKFNNSLLLKIRTKKAKIVTDEEKYLADVDYINRADIPESYFSPSFTVNILLGGLFGLLIGIFSAFTANSEKIEIIETAEDLADNGFKLLGQIPSFPAGSPILFDSLKKGDKKKNNTQILQAFSSVETYLKYGSLDKSLKSILITSSQQADGKSILSSNIAISLAKSGNKVLLVDANLKFPVLYKFFKVKSTPSLAHYLFRKKELDDIIRNTHLENLDLITCIEFPHSPSVIITSERMKNFMDQVKLNYDFVIYDGPSINTLQEIVNIAKNIDEVILIVRSRKSKLSELFAVQNLLRENSVPDFDIILNDVKG